MEEMNTFSDDKNKKNSNKFIPPQVEDFSFEVWYKNRCTAKVHSEGPKVYVESTEKSPVKRLFPNMTLTRHQASEVLKMRCWDPGRPDIKELLAARGLTEYVPLDIVRKTHGVSYNDFVWIKFPGENLRAEDVLVRTDWTDDDND